MRISVVNSDPDALGKQVEQLIRSTMQDATVSRQSKNWAMFEEYLSDKQVASPEAFASFLAKAYYKRNLSAGALATLRSDISMTVKVKFNKDWADVAIVWKVVEAVTKLKRPRPKYLDMWNIDQLYDHFQCSEEPKSSIGMRQKAITLVRASLAVRSKDVWAIARDTLRFTDSGIRFRYFSWKNQTLDNKALSSKFEIEYLQQELTKICAVRVLKRYMDSVQHLYADEHGRKHNLVWVFWNSGKPIVAKTVASDSKKVMDVAGMDSKYGASTIRHATISKWHELGIPRERVVRRTGHHSLNVISFYYDKLLVKDLNAQIEQRWEKGITEVEEESDEEI